MAHNSPVHEDEGGATANGQGPRPVPDFGIPDSFGQIPAATVGPAEPVAPAAIPTPEQPPGSAPGPATPPAGAPPTGVPVTDEDRQAYGRLLDRAFERGLLGSYDYEVRLRELSEATSVEEMKEIVTELPVFNLPTTGAKAKRPSLAGTTAVGGAGVGAKSPWTKLVVLVVAVAVVFVLLALYAEHVVHGRTGGTGGAPPPAVAVSPLRL
jgi:hypothetical protein